MNNGAPLPESDTRITLMGQQPGNVKQGWVQSDKLAHDAMWKVGMQNTIALPLLHYMVAHIKRGTNGMIVSAETLSRDLDVTTRTIQKAVAVLKQWNFVQVLKSGNANVYIINSQVCWQGNRGMRHATFNASIRVHEREQEKDVDQLIEENANLRSVPEMQFGENQELILNATATFVAEGDGAPPDESR